MKKIYFNSYFELTDDVTDGDKTMVRFIDEKRPKYQVGEIVAVAKCYEQTHYPNIVHQRAIKKYKNTLGWRNKMFVKAELMLDFVRITKVHTERLQDISDEDCIKEGIRFDPERKIYYLWDTNRFEKNISDSPRKLFRYLVNKCVAKGIWEKNPIVTVYEFELYDMGHYEKFEMRSPFL